MKFSTGLPGLNRYPPITWEWEASMGAEDFQLVARTADELGFDSIAISEHIVIPSDMVDLMGSFWSHAMTAMAFVAGATSRLIVDSAVIVMPYHNPVVFAKAVSTLDLLSGGGSGSRSASDTRSASSRCSRAPFHERGRMTDEYIAAMIELWTSDTPEFHGTYVDFDGIAFAPRPVQQPHPPIWIGGNSRAAMRRAARHDGWYPWLITAEQLPECLEYIRSLPEFETRTRPFDVALPLTPLAVSEDHRPLDDDLGRAPVPQGKQATLDAIGRLQEIGVTWTSVPSPPTRSLTEYLENLQWAAEEIIPAFR